MSGPDSAWEDFEYAVGGPAPPEEFGDVPPKKVCRRCQLPNPNEETRLAFDLCPDCYSDLCEKADSYPDSDHVFRRLLRESYEEFPVTRSYSRR